tara:strand:+ start:3533 stop:3739 length:207 start_codon:yes stop_codon:yes gene_type:complete
MKTQENNKIIYPSQKLKKGVYRTSKNWFIMYSNSKNKGWHITKKFKTKKDALQFITGLCERGEPNINF